MSEIRVLLLIDYVLVSRQCKSGVSTADTKRLQVFINRVKHPERGTTFSR